MAYSTLPNVPLAPAPTYRIANRVSQAQFGDGYEQVRPAGINYQRRQYDVTTPPLTQTQYDTLHDFLAVRLNLTPFLWTAPGDTTQRQWKCTGLGGPRMETPGLSRLQATFVEDFTP